jgi:hypothetical protein
MLLSSCLIKGAFEEEVVVGLELGVGLSKHRKFWNCGGSFVLNESSSKNSFHHSRKAIQLRTHLSNEALYQQYSDSNGTHYF